MRMCTRFFYLHKLHFYNQYQAEMGKIISKRWPAPWSWTFTIWKLIHFLHPIINSRCHPKIIWAILKMYKKQVSLFQWHNMINVNENILRSTKKIAGKNTLIRLAKKCRPENFYVQHQGRQCWISTWNSRAVRGSWKNINGGAISFRQ